MLVGILSKIRKVCINFLWSSHKEDGIPLIKWSRLVIPKKLGGWGIKNLVWFYKSHCEKLMETNPQQYDFVE
jgi:hypothetical protein